MIQIFVQPSKITQQTWEIAYERIKCIVENFPTKLVRLESYNGFEPSLDKKHLNLTVDTGTDNEHISIWGDWISYSGSLTIKFYKYLDQQIEHFSYGKEIDPDKPITWYEHIPYKNDGDVPSANGLNLFNYPYMDIEVAEYKNALLVIGTMLENLLPNAALVTIWTDDEISFEPIRNWLENLFGEAFDLPFFSNKEHLITSFHDCYPEKKHAVGRLAHLFRQKHLHNMRLAIDHIGYKPTFEFYSEVLADTNFGSFGFSDVFMPWVAATEDLDSSLSLVLTSKSFLLNQGDERSASKAKQYDLAYILKALLNSYILWSPLQREALTSFYTNQKALETGHEDLLGAINRMMGFRVNICPIYANPDELFETFMYHDSANAKNYKSLIDDWMQNSDTKYEKLKQELDGLYDHYQKAEFQYELKESDSFLKKKNDFLSQYNSYDRFFVEQAIEANPAFLSVEEYVDKLKKLIQKVVNDPAQEELVNELKSASKETHLKWIRYRIKKLGYSVHPDFEKWIDALEDQHTLFHLNLLMSLKLYEKPEHFTRFIILWDRKYWKFSIIICNDK